MAKTMARIENGVVVNLEWHSDKAQETDTMLDIGVRPVNIGDTYADGIFYREGEKVLTELEELQVKNAEYAALIDELYTEVTG